MHVLVLTPYAYLCCLFCLPPIPVSKVVVAPVVIVLVVVVGAVSMVIGKHCYILYNMKRLLLPTVLILLF